MGVKEVATKLQGRHLLSDRRAIEITAEYADRSAVDSSKLISTLEHQQAPPMEWNPHLQVGYGVTSRRDYAAITGTEPNTLVRSCLLGTGYKVPHFSNLDSNLSGFSASPC